MTDALRTLTPRVTMVRDAAILPLALGVDYVDGYGAPLYSGGPVPDHPELLFLKRDRAFVSGNWFRKDDGRWCGWSELGYLPARASGFDVHALLPAQTD